MSVDGLVCRDVSVMLGSHPALVDVDVTVQPGEWVGLIGPNGAGKSTLLRAVAGLAEFDGEITFAQRTPKPTDVAFVAQAPLLPDGMTVAEYVLLGRTAHLGWLQRESASDRQVATSVMRRLDLGDFGDRLLTQLSGGEAQRVVLARVLAQQAPVLLLDEPTSALDIGHNTAVLELIDELRRTDGLAVVAAMHDLTAAARFADRLTLLRRGEVAAAGLPSDVLRSEVVSDVYETPLTVAKVDDELVVLPARKTVS